MAANIDNSQAPTPHMTLDQCLTALRAHDLRHIKCSLSSIPLGVEEQSNGVVATGNQQHLLLINYSIPFHVLNHSTKLSQALTKFYNFLTHRCRLRVPARSQTEGSYIFSLVTILAREGDPLGLRIFRSSFSARHRFYGTITEFQPFPVQDIMTQAVNRLLSDEGLLEKARTLYERDSVWNILHISNLIINSQFTIGNDQKNHIFGHRRQLHLQL